MAMVNLSYDPARTLTSGGRPARGHHLLSGIDYWSLANALLNVTQRFEDRDELCDLGDRH
jgi:hypothetical protein